MTTFVLVHGAWHGGWCWRFVAPMLRRAGHEVFTPTLTGLGERAHLARPGIDLDLHVQDVAAVLEMEDLRDVVLLGHSYGGMVITGTAERCPERIRRLIYLDAFVPQNGECLLDCLERAVPERAAGFRKEGEQFGSIAPPPVALWGHVKPETIGFVKPRETRHPFGCFTQRLRMTSEKARALPRTFVYCSSPATGAFDQFAAKYRNDPAWRFHELKTGHDCMILVPEQVAAILLQPA